MLGELFDEGKVGVHSCTEALRREIRRSRIKKEALLKAELAHDFPKVEELFQIIDSPTLTAVVDEKLKDAIGSGLRIPNQEIQNGSVQIYESRVRDWAIREFDHVPGLFKWELGYDSFLGFMTGVLPLVDGGAKGYVL